MKDNIIKINHSSDMDDIDVQFADLISRRLYPIVRGIPFCAGKIEHNIDLFKGTGQEDKSSKCKSCKLVKWCDYNSKKNKGNFVLKPFLNVDKDLLNFLEERDEDSSNWF